MLWDPSTGGFFSAAGATASTVSVTTGINCVLDLNANSHAVLDYGLQAGLLTPPCLIFLWALLFYGVAAALDARRGQPTDDDDEEAHERRSAYTTWSERWSDLSTPLFITAVIITML